MYIVYAILALLFVAALVFNVSIPYGDHFLGIARDRDLAITISRREAIIDKHLTLESDVENEGGLIEHDATNLRDEQQRNADLADKLIEANAKLTQLQQLLTQTQARVAGLQRAADEAVVDALEARKQAAADRNAGTKARLDEEAELKLGQQRDLALSDRLAEATAKLTQLQELPTQAQVKAAGLQRGADRGAAEAGEAGEQVSLEGAKEDPPYSSQSVQPLQPVPVRPEVRANVAIPLTPVVVALPENELNPSDLPVHVVVIYKRGNALARARATAMGLRLRSQGLDVADPIGESASIPATKVSFFYSDDQRIADRVAHGLAVSGPFQRRIPVKSPLPRPGTIEIAIAG